MAGLIQDNMPQPEGQAPQAGGAGGKMDAATVNANIKVSPEMQDAYDRVVLAGMKVMFDKKTHEMAMKGLEGEGPISDRLGTAITALIALLMKQSNGTLPPAVMIPAGTNLLMQAADFLRETGQDISDEDIGEAMSVMIESMMDMVGMSSEKLMKLVGDYDQSKVQQAQGGGAAPAPEGQPAMGA